MDAQFIIPIIEATKSVISTMAQTEMSVGVPSKREDRKTWGAVTGIIGLAGENVNGNLVLSFDAPSILNIVSRMLGEEHAQINQDIIDAVGEITNMVCGAAKRSLSEQGYTIDMASPVVLVGSGIELNQVGSNPVLSVPFKTEKGTFVVESSLAKR